MDYKISQNPGTGQGEIANQGKPALISVKDLNFSYGSQQVLKNINLEIVQGDFIAMIGPNGGGKSTLLKLILGLLTPDSGHISILGQQPSRASSQVGYVPQHVHMNREFPISVLDVVLMGRLPGKRRWIRHGGRDRSDALELLERLEIGELSGARIGELSGGQRQRVFIARALMTGSRILLLDEPTAGIDSKGQADFYRLLKELNRENTILLVSHDLLVISSHVKSVACVNRTLHFHHEAEITGDMMEIMYPGATNYEENCPVELIAHGMPHRVLKTHKE